MSSDFFIQKAFSQSSPYRGIFCAKAYSKETCLYKKQKWKSRSENVKENTVHAVTNSNAVNQSVFTCKVASLSQYLTEGSIVNCENRATSSICKSRMMHIQA
jgi:hypothetical protein